jgi:bacteriocin biosynthesis cyclodehydratase domain-containing protein
VIAHRLLTTEGIAATLVEVAPGTADEEDAVIVDVIERAAAEGELLVLATTHLRPALSLRVNELAIERGVTVLHVCLDGPEARIGPVVVPGVTACYACWESQDEGSRHLRHDFLAYKDRLARVPSETEARPAVVHLAAAWAALAAHPAASGRGSFLHGRSLRVETERSEVVSHRILQLPRCPVCSRARHDLRHAFL